MPDNYFIRPSVKAIRFTGGNWVDVYDFIGCFDLAVWGTARIGDFVVQIDDTFILMKPDVFNLVYQKGT